MESNENKPRKKKYYYVNHKEDQKKQYTKRRPRLQKPDAKINIEGFYCRCKGCGKSPYEIMEYVHICKAEGYESPEEFVRQEEGTFNPSTGLFWCTDCYIKAGMPKGKA